MKRLLVLSISFILSGCANTEKVDKGLCLKFTTFISERMECAGGRGIAAQICVVRHVPMTHCTVWEWPEGRPEEES